MSRILIADDDAHIRNVVALKLRNAGFDVEAVENGQQGIAAFEAQRPDLIITDYQMPIVDGVEMCRSIIGLPGGEAVPKILLTARGFSLDDETVESLRLSEILSKPFSPRQLLATVQSLLIQAA
ncbi:MAG: response regulator [Phycisphaerae bacterium]